MKSKGTRISPRLRQSDGQHYRSPLSSGAICWHTVRRPEHKASAAARARKAGRLRRAIVVVAAALLVVSTVAFLLLTGARAPAYASSPSTSVTPPAAVLGAPAIHIPSPPGTPPTAGKILEVPILLYHFVDSTLPAAGTEAARTNRDRGLVQRADGLPGGSGLPHRHTRADL